MVSTREHFVEIQTGETLHSVLNKYGFDSGIRGELIRRAQIPGDFRLPVNGIYVVSVQAGEAPARAAALSSIQLRFFSPNRDISYVFWRDHRHASAEAQDPRFETRARQFSGRVSGSLTESLFKVTGDSWISSRFQDAYVFDVEPAQIQRGSRFQLKVEEKYYQGRFVRFGEVLRTSLEVDGRLRRRDYVAVAGGGAFIDRDRADSRRPLYAPVNYVRVSSPFQLRRFHPIRRRYVAHLGCDFERPAGSAIYSAQSGRVQKSGYNLGSGFFAVIDHGSGLQTSYSHMRTRPRVNPGAFVKAGDIIGEVGCTGLCTSAHLHFTVKRFGQWINPVYAIRTYARPFEAAIASAVTKADKVRTARARIINVAVRERDIAGHTERAQVVTH